MTDSLLAKHWRLFSTAVPPGRNRLLVAHRTPAIMIAGEPVPGRAFPEGVALVVERRASAGFAVIEILEAGGCRGLVGMVVSQKRFRKADRRESNVP